jgi:hypothetical protein
MYEVAVFLGQATADGKNAQGCAPGNRHAVVVFLRQEQGASPDFGLAEKELSHHGWVQIEFSKVVHDFPAENLNSVHPHAGASYEDALNKGFATIVFADPITDAL